MGEGEIRGLRLTYAFGQRSLAGCGPWGHKESDMTEHAHMHSYIYKRDKQQGPTYCIAQ